MFSVPRSVQRRGVITPLLWTVSAGTECPEESERGNAIFVDYPSPKCGLPPSSGQSVPAPSVQRRGVITPLPWTVSSRYLLQINTLEFTRASTIFQTISKEKITFVDFQNVLVTRNTRIFHTCCVDTGSLFNPNPRVKIFPEPVPHRFPPHMPKFVPWASATPEVSKHVWELGASCNISNHFLTTKDPQNIASTQCHGPRIPLKIQTSISPKRSDEIFPLFP